MTSNPPIEPPKKRGRKKKIIEEPTRTVPTKQKKKTVSKNIINMTDFITSETNSRKMNIILYLKCHLKDIDQYIIDQKWKTDNLIYDPQVPNDILPYSETKQFQIIQTEESNASLQSNAISINTNWCSKCSKMPVNKGASDKDSLKEEDIEKIKELKLTFYKNDIPDKKVDCFWCTCPFDNDPFYILQHGSDNTVLAHGSFCSPECSVAYLFGNMNWDESTKMDSYSLINTFYNSSSDSNENIKPACSPFYFLDKYYGNLTIHEYRRLSKSRNVMLCIDKPVTRILPELHEDNEAKSISGSMTQPQQRGNYRVKRQSEKNATVNRNDIIRDNFRGMNSTLVSV
jgi:hypothetical protein